MQRRTKMKRGDDAVSPVVAVMLMLVVTIIIAAVVSTMAGGLFSTRSPAPTISAVTEYSLSNGLSIDVLSVSEAIDTADLELRLDSLTEGTRHSAVVVGSAPRGVTGSGAGITYDAGNPPAFGNFSLMSGVKLSSTGAGIFRSSEGTAYNVTESEFPAGSVLKEIAPDGSDPKNATTWGGQTDTELSDYWKMNRLPAEHPRYYWMMKFNEGWEWNKGKSTITYYPLSNDVLKAGDKVSVKVVYVPNGQTIYSSDVRVVS